MKVTYKGDSKAVVFDGVEFPQGQAVEYTGSRGEKLKANRFFDVAEAKQKAPAKPKQPAKQKAPAKPKQPAKQKAPADGDSD